MKNGMQDGQSEDTDALRYYFGRLLFFLLHNLYVNTTIPRLSFGCAWRRYSAKKKNCHIRSSYIFAVVCGEFIFS